MLFEKQVLPFGHGVFHSRIERRWWASGGAWFCVEGASNLSLARPGAMKPLNSTTTQSKASLRTPARDISSIEACGFRCNTCEMDDPIVAPGSRTYDSTVRCSSEKVVMTISESGSLNRSITRDKEDGPPEVSANGGKILSATSSRAITP